MNAAGYAGVRVSTSEELEPRGQNRRNRLVEPVPNLNPNVKECSMNGISGPCGPKVRDSYLVAIKDLDAFRPDI